MRRLSGEPSALGREPGGSEGRPSRVQEFLARARRVGGICGARLNADRDGSYLHQTGSIKRTEVPMRVYRMPVIVRPPGGETEGKYLAEVSALPGCRAWGDTMEEALTYAQGVAAAFIASYGEHGEPLPNGIPMIPSPLVGEG